MNNSTLLEEIISLKTTMTTSIDQLYSNTTGQSTELLDKIQRHEEELVMMKEKKTKLDDKIKQLIQHKTNDKERLANLQKQEKALLESKSQIESKIPTTNAAKLRCYIDRIYPEVQTKDDLPCTPDSDLIILSIDTGEEISTALSIESVDINIGDEMVFVLNKTELEQTYKMLVKYEKELELTNKCARQYAKQRNEAQQALDQDKHEAENNSDPDLKNIMTKWFLAGKITNELSNLQTDIDQRVTNIDELTSRLNADQLAVDHLSRDITPAEKI